ncbi:hypothetical protein [Paracraurococcus ruber]|uniref:Uncharacterized protein n=1 Tax=Paracraurococcus ruber TaxID=77675 RepID=A0ABS1CR39_9PROT|nr:hypothetical protein [Paracraurococcus ruber]MBK1656810.1 hypothetical protein [Paracraurococcus ruber]TDG33925.1 hypothetical protein E2C05_01400 [Paracraurococcus ruber]
MTRRLIPVLALLATVVLPAAALAQDSGGLDLSPQALAVGGPRGLARPLPFVFPGITAGDLQAGPTPAERRQQHQQRIAKLRGDAGFLEGFAFGQPRAASRQPPPPPPEPSIGAIIFDQRTRVVNRFEAPVAVTTGSNNVVQLQGAGGQGPTAQQQVVTTGGRTLRNGGGAVNVIGGDGSIVQSTPAGASRPR